jgi:DNA-binding NarL/FixJ family response regulator
MSAPRVLLADGDASSRGRTRGALEHEGFTICAEADDSDGAIAQARTTRPDLALLEVRMPGNGLRAAADIASSCPEVAVVMLTTSRDETDLLTALRFGVSGYLLKDTDLERMPYALRAVLEGEVALPRSLVGAVIEELRGRRDPARLHLANERAVRLTDREWEVLMLLGEGLTTADVAQRLFVSQVTVRTHVAAAVKKLQVDDRAAAIDLLREVQSIDQPDV